MQLVYTSLLIITLRFTCGEMKICSTIKMSQNIMNMIAARIFFSKSTMETPERFVKFFQGQLVIDTISVSLLLALNSFSWKGDCLQISEIISVL